MSSAMKYKRDFLKANRVTQRQFSLKYTAWMEQHNLQPSEQDYRDFAKKWNITIHPGLGDPKSEAVFCVQIAALKVLAYTELEAYESIQRILEKAQ